MGRSLAGLLESVPSKGHPRRPSYALSCLVLVWALVGSAFWQRNHKSKEVSQGKGVAWKSWCYSLQPLFCLCLSF